AGACPLRAPAGNPQILSISAAISAVRLCAGGSSGVFAHALEAKQTTAQASIGKAFILTYSPTAATTAMGRSRNSRSTDAPKTIFLHGIGCIHVLIRHFRAEYELCLRPGS